MRLEEIKDKVFNSKEYEFLWTDPHLGKDKILFLTLGGSHSYGTNIETSDVDVRGVALNSERDVLGITHFEQRQDKATDTTIYSLNKFINLVTGCNPNIIEMLFCKPEHYLYVSPLGKILLDNRHLFLTKRAYYTFGGYAHAQLNRLENALCRDGEVLTEEEMAEHICRSVDNCMQNCVEKLKFNEDEFKIYVDENNSYANVSEVGNETYGLYADINLKHFPLAYFRIILSETSNVVADYKNTEGQRNKKKDDLHLNKHMMHLVRCFIMGNEILKDCTLHTYREVDHDLLMSIRNGEFRTENGGVKPEFYELIDKLEKEADYWKEHTTLPRQCDNEAIYQKILKPIYKEVLFKEQ